MSMEKCVDGGGFVRGAARYQAWSLYDMDGSGDYEGVEDSDCEDVITDGDILVAWDIDREDEAGTIPRESFEHLLSKLKAIIKGKKKATTT